MNDKSIYNIVKVDSLIEGGIDREFIAKAFFLPKEIIYSGRWIIDTIRVCTGDEWKLAKDYLKKSGAHIAYDPNSEEIIAAAKHVGVSIRRHAISGETFVVVKLWYGSVEGHQLFAPRKQIHVSRRQPVAAIERN